MKNIANRLFVFAAAALSLGTIAYGQTLKADVPFAFRTVGATEQAGSYIVKVEKTGNGEIVHINSRQTGANALSLARRADNKFKGDIAPHLVFRCDEAGCQLAEVWTLTGGYQLPVSRVRNPEYLASVPLVGSQN